jgi:putative tricarboxylic transport membrane protein
MIRKPYTRREALRLAAIGGAGAAAALSMPSILRAQDYPSRPVTVVVPFDTGGYNDRLARAFAPFLQEKLGQPITVVNRPGAGAQLGHTYFLQQPDDGYTILCTSAAPYIPLNILLQDADFTADDFHMINLPSRDYTLIATSAGSQLESIQQVIDSLKENPGSLSIGVQPASADYVNLMLLMDAHDIPRDALRIVTFDGGGPTRNAAAGGVVDIGLVGGEGFLPLAEQIRPLLVFEDERVEPWEAPSAAEVAQEGGYEAQFVAGSQRGWVVHASMLESHPDVYETLETAIEEATTDPQSVETLQNQQLATRWYGPENSNEAYRRTFQVMEQHIDLLRAS